MKLELNKMAEKVEAAEVASNVRDLNRAAAIWWLKAASDNLNSAINRLTYFSEVKI